MSAGRRLAATAAALATLALLAAPVILGAGGRVLAHAQLVASSPAAGSVLDASPPELRLVFSEPLEAELTSLDVVADDGTPVLDRAGEVDAADRFALVVVEPALPDGVYVLTWRTLSAADGHTAEGFFTFGIGDVADALQGTPVGGMTHTERELPTVLGRWATYLGLLLALGLPVFVRVVVGTAPMAPPLVRLLAAGLALSALATLALAVRSALESGEPASYLLGGRNGLLQLARAGVALVGAASLLLIPRNAAAVISAVAGLGGVVLLVAAGHASAIEGPAPILTGVIHVAAAAAWAGGVAGLLLLTIRPAWLADRDAPSVRDALPRFSAVALVSVGLAGVTGLYAAWSQTGSVLPQDTEYGRTLLLKVVGAAAAVAIGAVSYLVGSRTIGQIGSLAARLRLELALVTVVLALTAALAVTQPVDEARGVPIEPIPDAFGQVAPGMRMDIAPGRPGVNRITVVTTDALAASGGLEIALDRIDDGSSTRVPLILAGLEGMEAMEGMDHSGLAERNEDGTIDWYADAVLLPPGSSWDASVHVVSTEGAELSRQRFAFAVDDEGIADGRLSPITTPGNVIALVLVVGGGVGTGLGIGGMALPRCEARASRRALLAGGATAVVLGIVIGAGALVG